MTAGRVLGIDACKSGWIGIALTGGTAGGTTAAYTATHIDELAAAAHADGPIQVVAIDMPIGLPDTGTRRADRLARAVVGPRRSSVFITPVRAALEAPDHATATAVNQQATGAGVSAQAFALRHKLLEVDAWVRHTGIRVVEVHPEVSFATLAGRPLPDSKRTWAGTVRRRRLLTPAGIVLDDDLGPAGSAGAVDDILDAAIAAWTARRVARDEAQPMPDPPDMFTDGIPSAIWTRPSHRHRRGGGLRWTRANSRQPSGRLDRRRRPPYKPTYHPRVPASQTCSTTRCASPRRRRKGLCHGAGRYLESREPVPPGAGRHPGGERRL